MATAKSMAELYEREKDTTSKYVHATSRGHESAQLALALHLEPKDYVAPYYRDDSLLLGIGMTPKDLMLQLLAKVPRGRFLEIEEFTSLICWLSSEENSFSTAAVFDISGGRSTY